MPEPTDRTPDPSRPAPDRVLATIRALLAKAESTDFDAEAEAFTAKAHELMVRHSVDAAVLDEGRADGGAIAEVELRIDPPYVRAKAGLLGVVARASGCRAVHVVGTEHSSLFGPPDDVAAVEVLYTSLLVQAQRSLAEVARLAPAGSRPRSRAFRRSYLLAYATRIGERLLEVQAAVHREHGGSSLALVLASRTDAIDERIAERFGHLTWARSPTISDRAGWASGQQAADRARLTRADLGRSA